MKLFLQKDVNCYVKLLTVLKPDSLVRESR